MVRLTVKKLPSGGVNKPVWLWWSGTGASTGDVDRCWQAFLRRFDVEHTFRLLKQTLGWTKPKLRDSRAADRWTWIVPAAHAQLRLARPLARDLRRPWERPAEPNSAPPRGSGAGSGTCTRIRAHQPVHQNPPAPAPAAHSAQRTGARLSGTTSGGCSPPASPTPAPHTTRRERSPGERPTMAVSTARNKRPSADVPRCQACVAVQAAEQIGGGLASPV